MSDFRQRIAPLVAKLARVFNQRRPAPTNEVLHMPELASGRLDRAEQARLAGEFRDRHREGGIVVLPNAFDVATARLIARRDPVAIGTTSSAMAAIHGYADSELMERAEMLTAIARMADAVDVGISADVEAGYGDTADDARDIAERLLEIGVIGVNIQDTGHPTGQWAGGMLPLDRAAEKIRAVRAAADAAGVPLVINARTDTYLEGGDAVLAAIERGNEYFAAGADCVFAPGVTDQLGIDTLVEGLAGPLNVYAVPGTPTVAELERQGVRRVSVGCGPYQACLALVDRATEMLLDDGTYAGFTAEQMAYGEMISLLAPSA